MEGTVTSMVQNKQAITAFQIAPIFFSAGYNKVATVVWAMKSHWTMAFKYWNLQKGHFLAVTERENL